MQKTKELNAYCMPGGRIMVYSGSSRRSTCPMRSSPRCIGHEIAHALREHTRERVSRAYAQQLVLSGAAAVTGVSEGAANIANMVAEVTFQLPFSRDQESEADTDRSRAHGASRLRSARRDHAVEQDVQCRRGGSPPKFLSTHPAPKDRIKDIEKNLPRVLPLYANRN